MPDSNDYPKMLYHADGRTQIVHSAEEGRSFSDFGETPSDIHRQPPQLGAVRVIPASSGNDDLIAKFRSLLEEFFGSPNDPENQTAQRGRGRPRKETE